MLTKSSNMHLKPLGLEEAFELLLILKAEWLIQLQKIRIDKLFVKLQGMRCRTSVFKG